MTTARTVQVLALALCFAFPRMAHAVEAAPAQSQVRRFALIAGANDGGRGRVLLRYASSDARAFARVMRELGGITPEDRILLVEPSVTDLTRALDELKSRLTAARSSGVRLEVVVYYSGHSDEQGLRLGEGLVRYQDLRAHIKALPADVRVAILDACSSGAMTRTKGGQRRPPFMIDESAKVEGHAILTSSSATEAAQESDTIGGSFFTHYLVSGLRGAADVTGDGRVTITEAYQFAFNETLARTESTQSGPQHPNYDIQLAGTGDLVITDLRGTSAILNLGIDLKGRIYLRDDAGHLVAELYKVPGRPVALGLEPGRYTITLDDRGSVLATTVILHDQSPVLLEPDMMEPVELELAQARGTPTVERTLPSEPEHEHIPFCATFVPGVATCNNAPEDATRAFSLNFIGRSPRVKGFEIGMLNIVLDGVQGWLVAAGGNINNGPLEGGQVAGAFNIVRGSTQGVLASGAFNLSTGRLTGVMGAGALNVSNGELDGVQGAGAFNFVNGNIDGVQAAGALNIVRGDATVVQGAGALNIVSGDADGIQAAGAANITGGHFKGAQVAAALNFNRGMRGAQIGVLNISGDVTGAQIGVLNIAAGSVSGSQIGILNIAGEYTSGLPVGLLSLVKDGQYHLDLWSTDVSLSNVSVKLGSRHLYTLFNAGYQPKRGDQPARTSLGFGIGATVVDGDRMFGAIDIIGSNLHDLADSESLTWRTDDEPQALLAQLRLMVGAKAAEHLGIYGGLVINGHLAWDETADRPLARGPKVIVREPDFIGRFWPSLFVGVQL